MSICFLDLSNIKSLYGFLRLISKFPSTYRLKNQDCIVNAKSLLGILSLSPVNDLELITLDASAEEIERLIVTLRDKKYIKE